ncbi:hypothetical protein F5Y13DRAFT_189420 [Hypoxylon sp. FL1857]|nr:hypothetical protein F5Y13DRAFT_189420 [Hypoxylon sp. FL1857]
MLQKTGPEVVGEHGPEGFAESDNEFVVFSAFAAAPVRQIIVDLAQPVAIICAEGTSTAVFNKFKHLYNPAPASVVLAKMRLIWETIRYPEPPRARQTWNRYESWKFPVRSQDARMEGSLHQLKIYVKVRE